MSDEPAASLLLLLRLKAFAPEPALAAALEVPMGLVSEGIAELARDGLVQHREGMATGWTLTPEGRRRGEQLLRAELDRLGSAPQLEACYRAFVPLNGELLSICTDWQTVVVDGQHVPNDHSDPLRDAAVLDRLDQLHRRIVPVLDALADAVARFGTYRPRLERAHEHVRAGRTEWLTKVSVDSYHGIWFELHEHLLVTLDRDRACEPLPTYAPTSNGDMT